MKSVQSLLSVFLWVICATLSLPAHAASPLLVDYAYVRRLPIVYDCGTLHLYLKNLGVVPVRVDEVWVNGTLMEDLPNDLAVWYQVLPNPVPPHKVADVMVRLTKPTDPPFNVRIHTSAGQTIAKSVDIVAPPLKITSIGLNDELDRLYIYLENTGALSLSVASVYLDVKDITGLTRIPWPQLLPRAKDCIIAELKTPLTQGEYISLKVSTKQGPITEAVVRVFSFFPITSWDGDTRKELHFDPVPLRINLPSNPAEFEKTKKLEPHRAYYLFEDPSCTDKRTKSILGTQAIEIIRRQQQCYESDPLHLGFTHICEYRKERGYFVYGEVMDIVFANPYELVFYGYSPRDDGYYVELAKKGCEPRPLMVIPEAFRGENSRYPTPEEERLIVYYEISRGAKGISYFVKGGSNGYQANPELEAEIGRINWELQQIKKYLTIGDPVPLAECNEPKVEANTILCGDEAIVLILINTHHRMLYENGSRRFEIRPKANLSVTVHLPGWLEVERAYEVIGAAEMTNEVQFASTREGAETDVIMPVDVLTLPRVFVIQTGSTE